MPTLVCAASCELLPTSPLRRDGEVADVRRAVAGGHPAAELPGVVEPIEQPGLGRGVEKVALDRVVRRHRDAAGIVQDRVDGRDGGVFDTARDIAHPARAELDLLAHAAAPVDLMAAVVERRELSERGIAAGRHVPGVVAQHLRSVPELGKVHGLETEQAAALRDVGAQVVGRAVADRAGGTGRLVDVLVVEHRLRAPGGLVVEIMLPAHARDAPGIVAAEARLLGGLCNGGA